MADAVLEGMRDDVIEGVEVRVLRAPDATADDVLWADAVVLGTPENFGYMSGLMKDFLERIYYACLDVSAGRPYALFVKASTDGEGAVSSVERILTGLRWKAVLPPIVVVGDLHDADLERCHEFGATMAAGLATDVF
jgi:multimeric flavodoxin WrbA